MKQYIKVNDQGEVLGSPEVRDISSWDEVSKNNDGSYSIREYYDNPPTFDPAINKISSNGYLIDDTTVMVDYLIIPLTDKEIAQNTFDAVIQAGFDTQLGYRLFLLEKDRATLQGMETSINLGLALNQMTNDTMVAFTGMDNKDHPINVGGARQVLFAYAAYYMAARAAYRAVMFPEEITPTP